MLVPAGMPRKPGQTRDDLFKINADIAKGIVEACAKFCRHLRLLRGLKRSEKILRHLKRKRLRP